MSLVLLLQFVDVYSKLKLFWRLNSLGNLKKCFQNFILKWILTVAAMSRSGAGKFIFEKFVVSKYFHALNFVLFFNSNDSRLIELQRRSFWKMFENFKNNFASQKCSREGPGFRPPHQLLFSWNPNIQINLWQFY